jgi:hypothetical protein
MVAMLRTTAAPRLGTNPGPAVGRLSKRKASGDCAGYAAPAMPTNTHDHTSGPALDTRPDWARIAPMLRDMGEAIDSQQGDGYRAHAWRHAADFLERAQPDLRTLRHEGGLQALEALPTIGRGIAAAIVEILDTGRWRRLAELRGDGDIEELFRTVPGIGDALARQVHEVLGASSLEALEQAAHDGQLLRLSRVGTRRAAAIGAAVGQMLDRAGRLRHAALPHAASEPPVELLLRADTRYREDAAAGRLLKIAPRRFNPDGRAWLPVMQWHESGWRITALFSNTERAHRLGRTHDWVVLYCEDEAHGERQYTVVTAQHGPLAGRRVVRGREDECRRSHAPRVEGLQLAQAPAASPA